MQEDTNSNPPATASTKPFWQSKTIIGVLPVVIASAAPSLGLQVGDEEAQNLVQLISALASLILVILGRKVAKKSITLK
jgi:hypothetical protein